MEEKTPELSFSSVWVAPLALVFVVLGGTPLTSSPLAMLLIVGAVALALAVVGFRTLRGHLRLLWLAAWPAPLLLFLVGVALASGIDSISMGLGTFGSLALGLVALGFAPSPVGRKFGYATAYAASLLPFFFVMGLAFHPCNTQGVCL